MLEYNKVKESEMKENFQRNYLRRKNIIIKGRLHGRIRNLAIITWAVSLITYGAGTVKWTKHEPDELGQTIKKVMAMNMYLLMREEED